MAALDETLQALQGSEVGSENHVLQVTNTAVRLAGEHRDDGGEGAVLPHALAGGNVLSATAAAASRFGNVAVSSSTNVRVGDVTYITGNVYVTQEVRVLQQQTINQHVFLSAGEQDNQEIFERDGLRILRRLDWRADPPEEPLLKLTLPVSHVIISHTATRTPLSQEQVAFLVRTIQTYHVESREYADIAYNFLIGMDGNVYEGRGWSYIGSHTLGFNEKSIGICFVGTFMKRLPNDDALAACEKLIAHGIQLGNISKDYKLCAHCQISATESPGKMLYKLLQTWPQWAKRP